VPPDPYLAPAAIDAAGLHLLEQNCTREIVLPEQACRRRLPHS